MKQLIFLLIIVGLIIIGCKEPTSYQSVMPPLEKQEQPIQGGCLVEGLDEKIDIKYIKIEGGL